MLMPHPLLILTTLAVGACLGSFASVLIWRLHHEEKGIFAGRSRCPKCKNTLQAQNLFPIFSWIFQKGQCHHCKTEIPIRYPLIEIVFSGTFVLFVNQFWGTEFLAPLLLIVFFCLVLFFYDLWLMEVDNRIAFPAILVAGVWAFFRELPIQDYLIGGSAGLLFYAGQYYFSKGKWVGFGDLWLGLLMGLLLGWKFLFLGLLIAYLSGTCIALYLIVFKNYTRKSAVPMGAFLLPATLLMLYNGAEIWEWYWWALGV